jgi:hypothetical protein
LVCVVTVLVVIGTAHGERLEITRSHVGTVSLGGLLALYAHQMNMDQ